MDERSQAQDEEQGPEQKKRKVTERSESAAGDASDEPADGASASRDANAPAPAGVIQVWPEDAPWSPPSSDCPFAPGWFSERQLQRLLQHVDNPRVFTASLAACNDPNTPAVPVVAADLLRMSDWFNSVVTHRDQMAGGPLDRVRVPCDVPRDLLQAVITGMYTGSLYISATTLAPLLQLAGAMLMPELTDTCEVWAVRSLEEEDVTVQWVQHVYALAQMLELPCLQAAVQDALVDNCVWTLADNDIAALAAVLASQQLADDTDGQLLQIEYLVDHLRTRLRARFGPHCPEVFLVMLLVGLSRHGLRISPLLPHIHIGRLHKLDIQALVESEVACLDRADEVAFHRMLLKAALQPAADCKHAVFELKQLEEESVVLGTVSTSYDAGPCKVSAERSEGDAIGVFLMPPTRHVHIKEMGRAYCLYSLSSTGITRADFDLQDVVSDAGEGWGEDDIKDLLPSYRGLLGVFVWPWDL